MARQPDPFDEIALLIATARAPFPVSEVRLLIFQATAHITVTRDLASALGRFHITIAVLAEIVELPGGTAGPKRCDALDELGRLRVMCRQLVQ